MARCRAQGALPLSGKGFDAEPLAAPRSRPGETVPCDRVYAIENGGGRFDANAPRHLPKIHFLMLMRDERLATLESTFEEDTQTLTVLRDGKPVARGQLKTAIGRRLIEQFFAAYMKSELRGPPKIVHADGHSFSDVAAKCLHIVNLASVGSSTHARAARSIPCGFAPISIWKAWRPGSSATGSTGADRRWDPVRLAPFARTHTLRGHKRRSRHRRARPRHPSPSAEDLGPRRVRHLCPRW